MATFQLEVVAPDRIVWAGEADMLLARTLDGDIGVLANHIPMLGVLADYPVRVKRTGDSELTVNVSGGFLSVTRDKVSVLAESVTEA